MTRRLCWLRGADAAAGVVGGAVEETRAPLAVAELFMGEPKVAEPPLGAGQSAIFPLPEFREFVDFCLEAEERRFHNFR